MRSIVALFAIMVSLVACAQEGSSDTQYKAGEHYQLISPAVRTANPNKIEVTEVFWYGCGHCFHFEPMIKSWKKKLADDVQFVQTPAMWNKPMQIHARAFYTAQALGVGEKLHQPIFDAINLNKKRLTSEDELAALFAKYGVSKEDFSKAFNSFGVTSQVKQADSRARSYRISGTPELIVNGKYRISAAMAGGQSEMLKVADYLITKERREQAK